MNYNLNKVFYPPVGISHITNSLIDFIKYKIGNKKNIIINTSSQPNSSPHLGTITTLMVVFAFAKKLKETLNLNVIVQFDELENSPATTKYIYDSIYCKSLNDTYIDSQKLSEKNMINFINIFEKLKINSSVDYKIRTFDEFQKNVIVRKILDNILDNKKVFEPLLSPATSILNIRTKCPICNWMSKDNKYMKFEKTNGIWKLKNFCFLHKEFTESLNESKFIDLNTSLRDLIKGALILEEDEINNTFTIMIDGGDWAGLWDRTINIEGLIKLNYFKFPVRFFAPVILDWSGAKFSKTLYLENDTYLEQNRAFNSYESFNDKYGQKGFNKLWNEVINWIDNPQKFFRNYSVEYFNLILQSN